MKSIAVATLSLGVLLLGSSGAWAQTRSEACAALVASPDDPETPEGQGIEPQAVDLWTAKPICGLAAKEKDASARDLYHYGRVLDLWTDYAGAMRQYEKGAARGHAMSINAVGSLYGYGQGVERDYAKALDHFRRAYEIDGLPLAAGNLGYAHVYGQGTEIDYHKARPLLEIASASGVSWASNEIGLMHEYGRGTQIDYGAALTAFRLAFAQGEAVAANNIGIFYEDGHGVAVDQAEAVRFYQIGTDRGEPNSTNNLGRMYELGLGGLEPSGEKAVELFVAAGAGGIANGYRNAGRLYSAGVLVERDMAQARDLFGWAIEMGDERIKASARNSLAYSYAYEEATPADLDMAIDLVNQALAYDPQSGSYLDTLAVLQHAKGDHDAALISIEKAMEIDDSQAEIFAHAGDIYTALERPEDARKAYEQALEREPERNLDPTVDYDAIRAALAEQEEGAESADEEG